MQNLRVNPTRKYCKIQAQLSQNKSRSLDQKKRKSDLVTHFRSFELFDLKRAEMSLSLLSCFYKLSKKCYRTCNRPRRSRRSATWGGRSPLRYLDFDPGSIRTLNWWLLIYTMTSILAAPYVNIRSYCCCWRWGDQSNAAEADAISKPAAAN